jgi:hypothetical protein
MIRPTTIVLDALAVACGKAAESPRAAATDSTPPPAPLAYLAALAGQDPADAGVWESEPLRSRMTRLLGGDYEAFRNNIRTSGPLSMDNGLVYITGTCPSNAKVWGASALVADPAGDRLVLKMYSQQWDSVRTYKDAEILALPKAVVTTLGRWIERIEKGRKPASGKKPVKQEPG